MANWNKWIGGALGWAMGGPIGGILGFALGAISDEATQTYKPGTTAALPNDFSAATVDCDRPTRRGIRGVWVPCHFGTRRRGTRFVTSNQQILSAERS